MHWGLKIWVTYIFIEDDPILDLTLNKALKKENCISKSISETKTTLHQQINLLSKINCQDKLGAAEKYAKFVALSKKNLDQLQGKFFDHLRADLGEDEERDSRLLEITTDLKSVTNGHLKEAFKIVNKVIDYRTNAIDHRG